MSARHTIRKQIAQDIYEAVEEAPMSFIAAGPGPAVLLAELAIKRLEEAGWQAPERLPAFVSRHQLGKLARRSQGAVAQEGDYEADTELVGTLEDAEVILSDTGKTVTVKRWGAETEEKLHRPIIDLDFPAALVPSSTPGHFHLYLDKEMTWETYQSLLHAFEQAGLIEPGYLQASTARQFTSVRLPWVKKEATQ